MCVCVCICICIYIYIGIYTHIYIYTSQDRQSETLKDGGGRAADQVFPENFILIAVTAMDDVHHISED